MTEGLTTGNAPDICFCDTRSLKGAAEAMDLILHHSGAI